MAKTPCKSFRRDGSPCQGQGLKQFDGYCIAHAPADKTRAWRARGGKNSSTAARLDKRIPERLQGIIKDLAEGMNQVREGTLSPANFNSFCRGAKTMVDLYRLADKEMETIRKEEMETAAAEIAGAHGDLDILAAADAIIAQQDLYRADSFVEQGLAEPELKDDEIKPAKHILTAEGKKRFGYRVLYNHQQKEIDEVKEAAEQYTFKRSELPLQIKHMAAKRTDLEKSLADCTRDPESDPAPPPAPSLPCDPLTGQPFNELPAGVTIGPLRESDEIKPSPAILEDQIQQLEDQIREYEKNYEIENYDMKRKRFHAGLDPEDDSLIFVKGKTLEYPSFNMSITTEYVHKIKDKSQK